MKGLKVCVCILAVAVVAAASFFANAQEADKQEQKIGYINLGKTFDEYEKTQQYEKSLGEKSDKKEKEREKLVDDIKKLKDEMILLSEKGKVDKQEIVDDKIKELQDFDKETRDELKSERDDIVRNILREIDGVIQDFGKQNAFSVILNDRILVYGNKAIDITEKIIGILNSGKKD